MNASPQRDWVLLIDDDPWALEVMQTMLEHHDIPAHSAPDEAAARTTMQRLGAPAVVILDVMMPNNSGYDICRRLRASARFHHTAIVFATALDDEKARLEALEAGADDLITKPISEALLVTRIRSLMELARLRDRNQARLEYSNVLDTIGEGVITLDHDDRVVRANGPARRLLGLPADQLAQVHLPSFVEEHWVVVNGSTTRSSDARLVWRGDQGRNDETVAALTWTSRELPAGKTADAAWTVVIRDVTDTWEQDRAVTRLMRTLNHKVRIPLTGVATSLELLADEDLEDPDANSLIDIARRSAQRLHDTLIRMLEFTEAVAADLRSRPHDLLHPRRVREQLGIGDSVEVRLDLRSPRCLDVELAGRGVRELESNAVTAGAGRLLLDIASNPDQSVTFAMTDDAGGIGSVATERIFEPFYQTDRTGEAAGTGLGLAILAAEVRAHGGDVGAIAPVGGPTTVWFRLPTESPADEVASRKDEPVAR